MSPAILTCVIVFSPLLKNQFQISVVTGNLERLLASIVKIEEIRDSHFDHLARYARENTPEDAVFITPPGFDRFRLAARRAIVVGFKMIGFEDRTVSEWRKRMFDCYGEPESAGVIALHEMDKTYKGITDEKLAALAEEYGALFAVLYEGTVTEFALEFGDDSPFLLRQRYKIVKVPFAP